MRYSVFLFVILIVSSCDRRKPFGDYHINKSLVEDSAMVVSAHPLASEIGKNILLQGGNAIDAAIAVNFALAVCYPVAGNIGGGGFLVYRDNKGYVEALDYREKAPSSAFTSMFLDSLGNVIKGKSEFGHQACGVPGTVAGMYEVFQKYSKLKNWAILVQPAIDVARFGFELTDKEVNSLNENNKIFYNINKRKTAYNQKFWKSGDVLKQEELAQTLENIRDHGRDGFYKGKVADHIVAEMNKGGGLITHEDLAEYNAIWRKPINFNYRGYKIYSMPPPSSGGIAINQLLKSVEPYNLKAMGIHSAEAIHLMVEAERRTYADRAKHLGDSDFYKVPVSILTDSNYVTLRMKNFDPKKANLSSEIQAGEIPHESEQTTHFNIVDQWGNAVALTTTLNAGYGSFVVVDGAGFILNNEMDDFSTKPGVANYYGLVGAEANKIEPKKRMLSSMTPTIIEKDGQLKMVVGTPGGGTIITSVFQTIVNVLDFGMKADQAVAAPRFHHQWLPDSIQIESNCLNDSVKATLTKLGHKFKPRKSIGRVEAIVVNDQGKLEGGADPRGDDDVKGF